MNFSPRLLSAAVIALLCARAGLCRAAEATPLMPWNEPTVRALIGALKDPNRDVRSEAAWTLGLLKRKDSIEPLTLLLNDPAIEARLSAIAALGGIGDPSAIAPLGKQLSDATPDARLAALNALGAILVAQPAAAGAGPFLVAAASDADETVRATALGILPAATDVDAEPTLVKSLSDGDARVRYAALAAMARAFAARPPSAQTVEKLVALLADPNPMIRAGACEALGALSDGTISSLVARLKDAHYLVRRSAAAAIGKMKAATTVKTAAAADPLVAGLSDPDHTVRATVAEALGTFTPAQAIYPIAGRLEDATVEVRHTAATALVKYQVKDALPAVAGELSPDKMVEARREAAWVLVEWSDPAVADIAARALEDEDVFVRTRALRVLRLVGDRRAVAHSLKVLPWGERMVEHDDEQAEAYLVAQKWPDPGFIEMLVKRIEEAPKWPYYRANFIFPPTTTEDVNRAIVTAGYFAAAHPDLKLLIENARTAPDFEEVCKQALATAAGEKYTPPAPLKPPPDRLNSFITHHGPGEAQ